MKELKGKCDVKKVQEIIKKYLNEKTIKEKNT